MFLCSCEDSLNIVFDTPFVYITDEGGSSSATITNELDYVLSALTINVNASNNYFKEPITIEYEIIAGDGLKESVDFKVQPNTKSPLTFEPGVYSKPVRIGWYKNKDFDPSKDCSLTVKITSSTLDAMVIGYPGPNAKYSSYKFNKITK